MRIQVLSDLHLEFHPDYGIGFVKQYLNPEHVDVLVLAGDITVPQLFVQSCDLLVKHYGTTPILYVPGNHEFYGSSFRELERWFSAIEKKYPTLKILYNEAAELCGEYFVGTTLWFSPVPDDMRNSHAYADFAHIKNFSALVAEENKEALKFLDWHVNSKALVITHFLPSKKSIAPRYIDNTLNNFFCHDLESMILERQPRLWVHGHTHTSHNYMIGNTHVICNPLGYINNDVNPSFIPNMLLET